MYFTYGNYLADTIIEESRLLLFIEANLNSSFPRRAAGETARESALPARAARFPAKARFRVVPVFVRYLLAIGSESGDVRDFRAADFPSLEKLAPP